MEPGGSCRGVRATGWTLKVGEVLIVEDANPGVEWGPIRRQETITITNGYG